MLYISLLFKWLKWPNAMSRFYNNFVCNCYNKGN